MGRKMKFDIRKGGERGNIEEEGQAKEIPFTADGASCNHKFFKMHGRTSFKTANICADEDRPIFFFSDPPHLMKTTRNCWANSFSHSYTRKLWVSSTRKE